MRHVHPLPILVALSLLIPGCTKSGAPAGTASKSYNDYKSSLFIDIAKQAGINFTRTPASVENAFTSSRALLPAAGLSILTGMATSMSFCSNLGHHRSTN